MKRSVVQSRVRATQWILFSLPPINCGSGKVLALLAFAPFVATVVSTSSTPSNSLLLDGPSKNIMHSSRFYNFGQSLADVDILTLFLANIKNVVLMAHPYLKVLCLPTLYSWGREGVPRSTTCLNYGTRGGKYSRVVLKGDDGKWIHSPAGRYFLMVRARFLN